MKKYVAITFDDGPNTSVTPLMLDCLKRHHAVATFFLNGKNINEKTAAIMERQVRMGCELENHSTYHRNMTGMTVEQIADDVRMTNERIYQYTSRYPQFFRPPFMLIHNRMFETVEMPFICGKGSADWSPDEPPEETARIILSKVKPADIILLHDAETNAKSARALDMILTELSSQEYHFVTVSQLFRIHKVKFQRNKLYTNVLE